MEDKDEEVFEDDKGLDTTISKSLSTNSLLEDRLVPRSLDLTLVSPPSIVVISKWYEIKEWRIKGKKVSKTGLKAIQL